MKHLFALTSSKERWAGLVLFFGIALFGAMGAMFIATMMATMLAAACVIMGHRAWRGNRARPTRKIITRTDAFWFVAMITIVLAVYATGSPLIPTIFCGGLLSAIGVVLARSRTRWLPRMV